MSEMIGMNLISDFVHSIVMTGQISNRDIEPVSALLIASPESGKTSIVNRQMPEDSTHILTDVTGRGLQQLCSMRPEITHFIFNDLVAIMSHRQTVNNYTLAMINAMTEEGIKNVVLGTDVASYKNGKRGIIACTTLGLIRDGRKWWNKIGLTSRMLPFCYKHSTDLQVTIKNIITDQKTKIPLKFKTKSKSKKLAAKLPQQIHVDFPLALARETQLIAQQKSEQFKNVNGEEYGYRRLYQFRGLVAGHALLEQRKRIERRDIDFLLSVTKYINYDTPEEI